MGSTKNLYNLRDAMDDVADTVEYISREKE